MKQNEVPQDCAQTLGGQRKPLYVVNSEGKYTTELSSGWDAEEVVLQQAIEEFESKTRDALERVKNNQVSPLEYYMYFRRMDLTVLSQSTGFFQWQVKRHLKPSIFKKLSKRKLERYSDALGIEIKVLQSVPQE